MKQNITLKQLEELNEEQQEEFAGDCKFMSIEEITIGEMIEFLEDNLTNIVKAQKDYRVFIEKDGMTNIYFKNKELCDALWEACKHKLNQTTK